MHSSRSRTSDLYRQMKVMVNQLIMLFTQELNSCLSFCIEIDSHGLLDAGHVPRFLGFFVSLGALLGLN
jgi:hypothetical protein